MKFIWSPRAIDDIGHLRDYIALDNPGAARKAVQAILNHTEQQLSAFPHSGRPGRIKGTFELVIPKLPYIIPYRLGGDRIEIIRVYHQSRHWPDSF